MSPIPGFKYTVAIEDHNVRSHAASLAIRNWLENKYLEWTTLDRAINITIVFILSACAQEGSMRLLTGT